MPRTVVTEKTVFQFDELSDRAKDKAREWYREASSHDFSDFGAEHVLEDAATIADLFGLDIRTRPVNTMSGTRYEPCIYYSGFSSQGDGACFQGDYSYKKGALKAVKDYAPQDADLHRIVKELQDVQRRNFYRIEANTKHRGHYNHSGCMAIEVLNTSDADDDETVKQCLRDYADWIYKRLEDEWDYQNSDEVVDENIRINEYEFDESGRRTVV